MRTLCCSLSRTGSLLKSSSPLASMEGYIIHRLFNGRSAFVLRLFVCRDRLRNSANR